MSQLQERITQFRKMASDDPDNELGHFRLGQLLAEAGQHDEAVKAFLTGLDPDTTDLLSTSLGAAVATSASDGEAAVKAGRVLARSKEERLRLAIVTLMTELDDIVRREAPELLEELTP